MSTRGEGTRAPGEHRVAAHLGVATADYDAQIRRWIPDYEELLAQVVAIVARTRGEGARVVVDLGAGTGALTAAVLGGVADARAVLVDIDPDMLAAARGRLAPFGDRCTFRRAAFAEPLPACDAVVASLALHHVADLAAKRALYAAIHAALRPGGALVVADATMPGDGAARTAAFDAWAAHMAGHGIARADADALFAEWAREDAYQPLATELALLGAADFAQPEVFWRRGPMAVYGGFRE